MVSYCCVKGCNNTRNKKKDPSSLISFHAFPSNQELKTKWLRAIGRPNWVPPNHTRVCSAHFNHDQINYDGCRIRIKDDAYPVNLLPLNSNFEASDVEACRICLATDVKMHSLRDSHLSTYMDSVAGFSQNYNIEGLPQFVCYQCAPCIVKWNKLIEKSMIAQATLLDIFAKNGKITKHLIKEQNRAELNLKTALDSYLMIHDHYIKYDDIHNFSHIIKTNKIANVKETNPCFKNKTESTYYETKLQDLKTDPEGFENKKCEIEANESEFNEIKDESNDDNVAASTMSTPVEDVILDNDLNEDLRLNDKKKKSQRRPLKKKLDMKKGNGLTPDETKMLKYFDIVKLSLQEQIQEWEKSTVRRPLTSETIYECEICYKAFANVDSYRVHVTYHDPSQGSAECPVCKHRFKNAVTATSHANRAHGKKFHCKSCPKTFNNVGSAKKHQRWHSGYRYSCSSCSFSTVHASSLGAHRARVHGGALACATCGRAFCNRRALLAHTHTAHRGAKDTDITKEYRCEECNIDFMSEGARRVHILTSSQHKNKPDLCNATVQDPRLRNTCKKCGTECASFGELVSHAKAEHPSSTRPRWRGDTNYPTTCQLCGEAISSRMKHWHHIRRHHPKEVDTYQAVITAVCDTCGKGFQNSTKLHIHQLRHRSPTVRCLSCPRMFYDKYALARHASTHIADKPHQCRICDRTFKLRANLERHSRVHSDIARYECTMCGKKFKYSSSVNLHVRTVHYKLPHPPRKKRSKSVRDVDLQSDLEINK